MLYVTREIKIVHETLIQLNSKKSQFVCRSNKFLHIGRTDRYRMVNGLQQLFSSITLRFAILQDESGNSILFFSGVY